VTFAFKYRINMRGNSITEIIDKILPVSKIKIFHCWLTKFA